MDVLKRKITNSFSSFAIWNIGTNGSQLGNDSKKNKAKIKMSVSAQALNGHIVDLNQHGTGEMKLQNGSRMATSSSQINKIEKIRNELMPFANPSQNAKSNRHQPDGLQNGVLSASSQPLISAAGKPPESSGDHGDSNSHTSFRFANKLLFRDAKKHHRASKHKRYTTINAANNNGQRSAGQCQEISCYGSALLNYDDEGNICRSNFDQDMSVSYHGESARTNGADWPADNAAHGLSSSTKTIGSKSVKFSGATEISSSTAAELAHLSAVTLHQDCMNANHGDDGEYYSACETNHPRSSAQSYASPKRSYQTQLPNKNSQHNNSKFISSVAVNQEPFVALSSASTAANKQASGSNRNSMMAVADRMISSDYCGSFSDVALLSSGNFSFSKSLCKYKQQLQDESSSKGYVGSVDDVAIRPRITSDSAFGSEAVIEPDRCDDFCRRSNGWFSRANKSSLKCKTNAPLASSEELSSLQSGESSTRDSIKSTNTQRTEGILASSLTEVVPADCPSESQPRSTGRASTHKTIMNSISFRTKHKVTGEESTLAKLKKRLSMRKQASLTETFAESRSTRASSCTREKPSTQSLDENLILSIRHAASNTNILGPSSCVSASTSAVIAANGQFVHRQQPSADGTILLKNKPSRSTSSKLTSRPKSEGIYYNHIIRPFNNSTNQLNAVAGNNSGTLVTSGSQSQMSRVGIGSPNVSFFGKLEHYTRLDKLGEGSYATVYKGFSLILGKMVALKEIRLQVEEGTPFTAIREASLLKGLKHANIVLLHDIVHTKDSLTFVFEYVQTDLSQYLEAHPGGISVHNIRLFLYQLLRGLSYCHDRKILHRDLKPQNLLINENGELKLADFGLARAKSVPSHTYSNEVVTLWYRPPDVLMGSTEYSTSLDMWGVGCIFLEMILGQALFPGVKDTFDQLDKIFRILGTPTERNWEGVSKLPNYIPHKFNWYNPRPWQQVSNRIGSMPQAEKLISTLLQLNPSRRVSARNAMSSAYFSDLPAHIHSLPSGTSIFIVPGVKIEAEAKRMKSATELKFDALDLRRVRTTDKAKHELL